MDPIFKGATRPAMVLGIPLLPLIICSMSGFVLSIWALLLIGGIFCILILATTFSLLVYMRFICKLDDQKLHQIILQLQSKKTKHNCNYWACKSSSPIHYTARKTPQQYFFLGELL